MADELLDRRFLVVIGKGGTGKTTVAGALALLAASRKKRVLVCMTQARERLSAMLETEVIGPTVQSIMPGIDAVNMDPEVCIQEYGLMILRVKALYKAVIDNKTVKGFLHAIPGMDAWSMLGKALFHAKEKDQDGRDRYDLVILDAPATGHGLQMLRVPQVILDVAPPGLLRREAEDGVAMLRNPAQAGMVVVTLAEEMSTTETEELYASLTNDLRLPIAKMVINQVLSPLFANKLAQAESAADVLSEAPAFVGFARGGRSRARREDLQRRMIERLAKLPGDKMMLRALAVERVALPEMESLARDLGSLL